MEVLKNPTPDKKDVYETFFQYAGELKKNHPSWDSESYIKERFGEAYNKMAEIAPEAREKYEAIGKQKEGNSVVMAQMKEKVVTM